MHCIGGETRRMKPIQKTHGLTGTNVSFSRRQFIRWLALTGGASLASCVARPSPDNHTSDFVQLVYQDWRTDWFPGLAQEMLSVFHEQHPSIHVFYTPDPENVQDQMMKDFQLGTAPDVMAGCCDFLPIWAQQGYLLDLRPFIEADLDRETISDWDTAQYNALSTPDGVQYAVPKYHGALALFFNKDQFDEHKVAYPDESWTHDDYLDAMRILTHHDKVEGENNVWGSMVDISWERLQVHVNGWGGHFVDPEDASRSLMSRPPALEAMRWIRDRMWEDRVMASSLDVQNMETRQAFYNGRLAMVEEGSWALKDILENAEFRIGIAPFPAGPVRRVTLATTDAFAINANTRYPEAAWELVKFLISKEYGRAMARAHFLQPARLSLVDEWVDLIRQVYPLKTRNTDIEAFADGHRLGYSVTAEIFTNMKAARDLTQPAWRRIFTLGEDPVEQMIEVSGFIDLAQPTGS